MTREDGPIIGVAWPQPDYLKALERAGARPRVLKPEHDPLPESLEDVDGVLLTGGADVDPARYGETERHETVKPDSTRDDYEFVIARYVLDHDLPVLAICRGAQLLNVVAGGTLVQDIPSTRPSTLVHRPPKPPRVKKVHAHDVTVSPGTCLAALIVGRPSPRKKKHGAISVNSRHHQAVRDVAPGFVVSATASDGTIEGIENPHARFCVGVQWHPENYWRTGEFSGLFDGLVAAAARRTRTSSART
jgi:putative glutamine amidotransferase